MSKSESNSIILDSTAIRDKVKRMAYEIYEDFFEEKELFLLGVDSQGYFLAQLIFAELRNVHPIKYQVGKVTINKKDPLKNEANISLPHNSTLKGGCVILIDDVLNSGKTLAYAMSPLLNMGPRKLQVCVLINRDHNVFPVSPNYVGLSLGTTLEEHVEVSLEKKGKESAFLH